MHGAGKESSEAPDTIRDESKGTIRRAKIRKSSGDGRNTSVRSVSVRM